MDRVLLCESRDATQRFGRTFRVSCDVGVGDEPDLVLWRGRFRLRNSTFRFPMSQVERFALLLRTSMTYGSAGAMEYILGRETTTIRTDGLDPVRLRMRASSFGAISWSKVDIPAACADDILQAFEAESARFSG